MDPICYADLWAPLRFAVPATHSGDVEGTTCKLDGDADKIGSGWCGPTYRKALQGKDVAVKVFLKRGYMEKEERAYRHLCSLQGKTIPRVWWCGELAMIADGIAMEYGGAPYPDEPTKEQEESSRRALDSVHACGVLHGNIGRSKFVCQGDRVLLVGFDQAEYRNGYTDEEWDEAVQREVADMWDE